MRTQDVIWTALPNGRDSKNLRLSVYVSPRLQTDEGLPVPQLSQFPDFLDWPKTKLKFRVFFGAAGPFDAKDVTKPNASSHLYGGVFKAGTFVRPHQFPATLASTVRIRSYPTRHVHQFVKNVYSQFVSSTPSEYPSFTQLVRPDAFGAIGFVGRDQGAGREQQLANALEAVLQRDQVIDFAEFNPSDPDFYAKAFLQAKRFHQPRTGITESPKDPVTLKKPTLAAAGPAAAIDFHQMLTMATEHPDLLRTFGFVIDLEVQAGSVPLGDTTIRVVPTWTPLLGAALTHDRTPLTRCRVTSSAFISLPRAVKPELADGELPFEDATRYEVLEVDQDGAALKAMHFANNLGRSRLSEHLTVGTPASYAPPALRSIGLSVARVGMARTLLDNIKRSDAMNASLGAGVTLDAEDITRGYAIHVWDSASGRWRSLLSRTGTYDFVDIHKTVNVQDEGAVSLGPTKDPLGASPDLYQQESLFLWSGWSLAAQRPGNTLVTDPAHDPSGPMQRVDSTADQDFRVQIRYAVTPGTLPRLRFGTDYRIRARAVDLAGNRMAFGDPTAADPHASATVTYARFEPVESPVVLLRKKVTPGESAETIVIRSNYNTPFTGPSERHVSPTKVAEMVAEEHGLFDTPNVIDHAAFTLISAKDDKSYASSGQASVDPDYYPDVQFFDVDKLTLPYLPDPIGRGASLRGLPGLPTSVILRMPFQLPGSTWPGYLPFRLILREGTGLPVRDAVNGTLTVQLDKADVTTVRLSTFLDGPDLRLMGVWQWLTAAAQAAILPLALDGQLWAITPWRDLTLVHAVRQPLINPSFLAMPGPFRDTIGQTFAFFSQTPMSMSRKSTGALKVFADWTEAVDAGPGSSVDPGHEPKSAVAFQVDLSDPLAGPDDTLLLQNERQEFHDTKYRRVSYRAAAASKFIEYFRQTSTVLLSGTSAVVLSGTGFVPGTMKVTSLDRKTTYVRDRDYGADDTAGTIARTSASAIPNNSQVLANYVAPPIERPGPSEAPLATTVDIPNSARPAAPKVLYVVPTWKRSTAAVSGGVSSTREGGGLRVYLDRPWWSSGDGELLGVLLWPGTFGGPPEPPDSLKPYVSRWGIDPIHTTASTTVFPTLDRFPAHVAQSATPLSLQELNDQPTVLVSGHDVGFDFDRKLWFCDIQVDPGPSYFPFIRLALARYQPISLTNAHLSRAVLADFIQTAQDRTFTVIRDPNEPQLLLLTAVGISYGGTRNADGTLRSGPSVMRVQLEQRSHLFAGDFGWQAVGEPVFLSPSQGNGPDTVWTGRMIVPPDAWPKRLVVEELERLSADGTFGPTGTLERLVYTDIVPISPDRFGVLRSSPAALDFGSLDAGSGTNDLPVVVANTGTAPLNIGAVSLMGPDAAQFSIVNDGASGKLLNPSDTATVTVRFAPTAVGTLTARLDIPNDAIPDPLDIPLTGVGVGAVLSVVPANLDFGFQLINTTSARQRLTLTNSGNANLVLGSLALIGGDAGDFALVLDPSGRTLAPGDTANADVTFTPSAFGPRAAGLQIPSNAVAGPPPIPLAGQGFI